MLLSIGDLEVHRHVREKGLLLLTVKIVTGMESHTIFSSGKRFAIGPEGADTPIGIGGFTRQPYPFTALLLLQIDFYARRGFTGCVLST